MLMLRKIKPICICPFQNSPAFNYLQTNTGRQKMIHGLIFSLSFVPPSPNLSTKKKIVIVIAKYYMTIHLKPGFRYELQLRLRCAMYVTQLLKLEKKQKVKTISDIIQQAANRYRTFDR
jgi:hypothetical protein